MKGTVRNNTENSGKKLDTDDLLWLNCHLSNQIIC